MSQVPANLKYSKEHEWVRIEGEKAYVGITDFAQEELGDIVFVELPATGASISANEVFGTVESVKTVSDLFAPVSGTVIEVNPSLVDAPESVNTSPYGDGWMIVIQLNNASELERLLDAPAYENLISG